MRSSLFFVDLFDLYKGVHGWMSVFRTCSGLVIRCFKRVEHAADWLTGKAGPVFVFLCWTLIILGGLAFCMYQLIAGSSAADAES